MTMTMADDDTDDNDDDNDPADDNDDGIVTHLVAQVVDGQHTACVRIHPVGPVFGCQVDRHQRPMPVVGHKGDVLRCSRKRENEWWIHMHVSYMHQVCAATTTNVQVEARGRKRGCQVDMPQRPVPVVGHKVMP